MVTQHKRNRLPAELRDHERSLAASMEADERGISEEIWELSSADIRPLARVLSKLDRKFRTAMARASRPEGDYVFGDFACDRFILVADHLAVAGYSTARYADLLETQILPTIEALRRLSPDGVDDTRLRTAARRVTALKCSRVTDYDLKLNPRSLKTEIEATAVPSKDEYGYPGLRFRLSHPTAEIPARPQPEHLNNRARVDEFIKHIWYETGVKIKRKDISTVAGYGDRTEFTRFQTNHGKKRNPRAEEAFSRVLRMTPQDFLGTLRKLQKS